MNLDVLSYIVNSAPEKIESLAKENNLESSASIGVAKSLLRNSGNVSLLSDKQRHHYKNCIKPLIENVPCDVVVGSTEDGDTCYGSGYIDDESLLGCYIEDDFKCQTCRHDAEKMNNAL